jgi:hypothetical protein
MNCILLVYLFLEGSLNINSLHLHCLIYFRHVWRVCKIMEILYERILKRNQLNWLVAWFEVFILIWQDRMNGFLETLCECVCGFYTRNFFE